VDDQLRALLETNPSKAMRLLRDLREKIMVPHPGQVEVLDTPGRFKVLNAGRRWGKTKLGVKALLDVALSADDPDNDRNRAKDRLVWWVAPTYRVVKRGYRETLRQLPREFLTHDPPPDTNFDAGRPVVLRLKSGTNIEFYSAERPAGMLGEGVNFVVQDEAASTPSIVWEQTIRPTLADKQGGAMLISTPRGRNWFWKRWVAGQDPDNHEWASWTFPSATNPYLAPEEIQAMKDELPALLFDQEVLAKFLASGSSVFRWEPNAVQHDQVLDNAFVEGSPPSGHVFLGIDLAKTNDYTVIYGANETDLNNCYFERLNTVSWPEQKRRIKRAVAQLKRAGATGVTLVMDSTGVGDPIVEDMEEAGFDVVGINFTTYKNKMVVNFAKDLEENKAKILDQGIIEEFENYAMTQSPTSGKISYSAPEGMHDDVVSAKILQHWGITQEGAPDVTTITASDPRTALAEGAASEDEQPEDDWSDLIDEPDGIYESDPREAGIALARALNPPSPEELLLRPELWR
jgi:hypothetical protein